ncbi:hypothetical protein STSP2_01094 [Anaerohalosphaera lusitana]|uniref:Uncharacterized protein n=1 Tax=Anaerohalosphaera lusitana TaxID=1936003 RepID=A0A1U9NJ29_9BACT|nr:hypothetical protein [Anaerohalosphaera lusitana]AQT67942.1 hypothetical protein STSP2_01094 [Anaerohalosphaera lusitana]
MSVSIKLADAIVAELNGHQFSKAFTAERKLLPEFSLAQLKDLTVTVVPRSVDTTNASRAMRQYEHQVDVGIQKKLTGKVDDELPGLMTLTEEIAEFFACLALPDVPNAVWAGCHNEPIYSPSHLSEHRTFFSILTLTYKVMK